MRAKKLLFLGDSFTVGTGLGVESEAFPFQLVARLREQGASIEPPKFYAIDGHTTKHLLGGLDFMEPASNPDHPNHKTSQGDYDMVVLSMGINDVFRGHSLADYNHHFAELLQRTIRFAGNDPAKVMVMTIPAWDASPSVHDGSGPTFRAHKYEEVRATIATNPDYNTKAGIAAEIDHFNAAANTVVAEENRRRGPQSSNISLIDLTTLTRMQATVGQDETAQPDATYFAEDGTHYSGKMYATWVAALLPAAQKILGMRST